MANPGHAKEFPNISLKLAAPKKLSAYEKEKQAAEAKRQRAKAEDEAALKAFQDDFDDDGGDDFGKSRASSGGYRSTSGSYGRHDPPNRFGGPPPRSGPGSLGPPPPSLKRKRVLNEMRESRQLQGNEGDDFMDQHQYGASTGRRTQAADHLDDKEEVLEALPTVYLSNLPLRSGEADVRDLVKGQIDVQSVEMLSERSSNALGMMSKSALVRLPSTTTRAQIDTIITALTGKYMCCGHQLAIKYHLGPALPLNPSGMSKAANAAEPFGARKVERERNDRVHLKHARPPGSFAPPSTFGGQANDAEVDDRDKPRAIVHVQPPEDLGVLRAIHTIADRLLSEPDPDRALEIEAMLMALPEVEKDERFAFLYDSCSSAGAYYRYLLWSDSVEDNDLRHDSKLFRDENVDWKSPHPRLPFSDLTELADARDHADYNSDTDSADGYYDDADSEPEDTTTDLTHKAPNPMWKAKLAWILATSPKTTATLTKSDVQATTFYAIRHADTSAADIVEMMVLNITKPFAYTEIGRLHNTSNPPTNPTDPTSEDDPSQLKLVALYLISDILGASKTAGLKGAYRYKTLFESAFHAHHTFEHLGSLDKTLNWGRMRTEKWRRAVCVVLECWEAWDVFSSESAAGLRERFLGWKEGSGVGEERRKRDEEERVLEEGRKMPRWLRNAGKGVVVEEDEDEDEEEGDNGGEDGVEGDDGGVGDNGKVKNVEGNDGEKMEVTDGDAEADTSIGKNDEAVGKEHEAAMESNQRAQPAAAEVEDTDMFADDDDR